MMLVTPLLLVAQLLTPPIEQYSSHLPADIVHACMSEHLTPRECDFYAKGLQWRDKAMETRIELDACKDYMASNIPTATPEISLSVSSWLIPTLTGLIGIALGMALVQSF